MTLALDFLDIAALWLLLDLDLDLLLLDWTHWNPPLLDRQGLTFWVAGRGVVPLCGVLQGDMGGRAGEVTPSLKASRREKREQRSWKEVGLIRSSEKLRERNHN